MRRWWIRLVFGLVIVILLVFAGMKLYNMMLGLLGVIASGGETAIPGEEAYVEEDFWTQPSYVADDSAYDDVSAVREYEEETPAPTDGE